MVWLEVALDWSNVGCSCDLCGRGINSGQTAFIALDTTGELKVVGMRCQICYRTQFPESVGSVLDI